MPLPSGPLPGRVEKLHRLLSEPKAFDGPEIETKINALIETLARDQADYLKKNPVLDAFRKTLKPLRQASDADKQRICDWMERILEIQGLESSDGLLDAWVNGISI